MKTIDRDETERLFRQESPVLLQIATRLLGDVEEARDTVSDMFERLAAGKLLPPHGKPENYLKVCMRNLCLGRLRHMTVRERFERRLTLEKNLENWNGNEKAELVNDIVAYAEEHLTPQQWRAFQMKFDEGLTTTETAQRLDVSEAAVYKLLAKAMRLLRSHFAK